MNMSKELEAYNEFLDIIEFPVKSHLLNFNDRPTLERYRVLRTQIETALEKLEKYNSLNLSCEELQFVSNILKNPDNSIKRLKALEFIKEQEMLSVFQDIEGKYFIVFNNTAIEIPQEKYILLKEVL